MATKKFNADKSIEVYAWVIGACYMDWPVYCYRIKRTKRTFDSYANSMLAVVLSYLQGIDTNRPAWEDHEHDMCMRAKRLFK